jgi:hypothetical protein
MALAPASFSNMTSFSIKDKQIDAIVKMLNLNASPDAKNGGNWQDVWKILIYDKFCCDIIAPIMKVGDLRKHGVTLHMFLHTDRQPIPDVPAIYFVLPTEENIKRICEDLKNNLYTKYQLNFASAIDSAGMEQLAVAALKAGCVAAIDKVYDQYLQFVSLQHNLFSLQKMNSYVAFNDPALTDAAAEQNIRSTVDGLFSVLLTLGVVPIIRAARNNAAELVAKQLDSKIRENIAEFPSDYSSYHRPVLVILERNVDLTTTLHHTWTYQALVHDLLTLNLNTVKLVLEDGVPSSSSSQSRQTVVYELDPSDTFWETHAATPFPKIGEQVKALVNEYTAAVEEAKLDEKMKSDQIETKELGNFINTLPELREKKKIIDKHTNIASQILQLIKARKLDTYFMLEDSIMSRSFQDKKDITAYITENDKGSIEDKVRLLLIYYLCNDNLPKSELDSLEEALVSQGADLRPLQYLKRLKSFNDSLTTANNPSGSGLRSKFESFLSAGVSFLLPNSKDLYITRLMDALMEMKGAMQTDSYLYFDPKSASATASKKTTPFKDAIVFIIGGGNYLEYQNLQDYAKKPHVNKRIIYGSTEIVNSTQFLLQLAQLAK